MARAEPQHRQYLGAAERRPAETLRRLLHELAHAERQSPRPTTVDDDAGTRRSLPNTGRASYAAVDVGASRFDGLPLS
ncbi:MAG: hypothetical protein U0Z44_16550 [Kouleothrix sp.]